MTCKRSLLGGVCLGLLAAAAVAAQAAPGCEAWNTNAYFETATVEDVTACLEAGPTRWRGICLVARPCIGRLETAARLSQTTFSNT